MTEAVKNIWIIGCGRFGKLALHRLFQKKERCRFLVVDAVQQELSSTAQDIHFVHTDGVSFLQSKLTAKNAPDWIVPALPLHLAAEWCLVSLGPALASRIPAPENIQGHLPNPISGDSGDLYASLANFRCPDDCPEPADHCTLSGEPRKKNMFDILKDLAIHGFQPLVLRSRQLAPGIGGYSGQQLLQLRDTLLQHPGRYLVCTACRCHGVVTPVNSDAKKY